MAAESVKDKQITKPTKTRKPKSRKTEIIIKTAQEHPDLTTREIGAIAGCTHVNVIETLKRYNIDHNQTVNYKNHRADILAGLQHRFLCSVTDADIKKTPVGSRILAVSQLYDKERLERGQSTENIHEIHSTIAEIKRLRENKSAVIVADDDD